MLTYKDTGVDIDKGNNFVSFIKKNQMKDSSVISNIGGYNALVDLKQYNVQDPILVFSTDGVGTKLKLATDLKDYENIGIDLVAMVANDIICSGATPKVFLDYISYSDLSDEKLQAIYFGIMKGCEIAGMTIIGGETAQLPGLYKKNDYDLAGFGMGIVDRDKVISQDKVKEGDLIIGLKSSGLHSNGFALINQILFNEGVEIKHLINSALRKSLLTPTTIYAREIQLLLDYSYQLSNCIHGLAHITGGGFIDNIPRILPEHLYAEIDYKIPSYHYDNILNWKDIIKNPRNIFHFLYKRSTITKEEMFKTFNCGIGMVIIIDNEYSNDFLSFIEKALHRDYVIIGKVKKFNNTQVYFKE